MTYRFVSLIRALFKAKKNVIVQVATIAQPRQYTCLYYNFWFGTHKRLTYCVSNTTFTNLSSILLDPPLLVHFFSSNISCWIGVNCYGQFWVHFASAFRGWSNIYNWVVYGKVCIYEWTPKRHVSQQDWTLCSYYINHYRFNNEHNTWGPTWLFKEKENIHLDLSNFETWQFAWFANETQLPIWFEGHTCLWSWKCPR